MSAKNIGTCKCNNCKSCEDQQLRAWISKHPYPSYEKMRLKIREVFKDDYLYVWAEYDHDSLKMIYESFIEKNFSKTIGEHIYEKGGMQALQLNCMIFKRCTPLCNAPFPINTLSTMIEWHWDNIGEFRR